MKWIIRRLGIDKELLFMAIMAMIMLPIPAVVQPTFAIQNMVSSNASVMNVVPDVHVELAPDDDPERPGVQVINPDPGMNKTVMITANISDINGYGNLQTVRSVVRGPGVGVIEGPFNLSFDHPVSVTTAEYKGTFNLSNHPEGEYKVEVNATDKGGLSGVGSSNFSYLYADITPPVVTNPSANPASVLADGVQESRLNVSVRDDSGVYSVRINLSSIGGPEAKEMSNIPGTDIYTTTTTVKVGTPPGDYHLRVNATDNSTNRNSNTSVAIQLTVLPPEIVTTYDFSTGAGYNRWAYRKQHYFKPPATNSVPRIAFSQQQYSRISANDGSFQFDRSSLNGYYAIHRFKFKLKEPESCIKELHVLWDGIGMHDLGIPGATLYIWNYESGAYEELDKRIRRVFTLEGTVRHHVGEYIDDGTLVLAVQQNFPQWGFWRWRFHSRIGTDYVRVDVIHTPVGV